MKAAAVDGRFTFRAAYADMAKLAKKDTYKVGFARDKGRQVFETLYQAHPEATALYSHNDGITMGAIAAMEAAGKVPGKDLIIGSIDGTKDAAQAIVDGKVLVVVECNPKFGPAAFAAIEKMGNGETLDVKLVNTDRVFTKDNVAAYMPEAY